MARKIKRMARNSFWCVGLGIGILIVRLLFPMIIGGSEKANEAFQQAGLVLVFYGGVQLLALAFVRKHALKVGLLMSWVIVPAIVAKMATGLM